MEKGNFKLPKGHRNNSEISTLIAALFYLIAIIVMRLVS